jgi:hypothetical protein
MDFGRRNLDQFATALFRSRGIGTFLLGIKAYCRVLATLLIGLPTLTSWCSAAVVMGGPPSGDAVYSINFDTFNMVNPTYTFQNVPTAGEMTVSFGTHFAGQTLSSAPNALSDVTPSAQLALDHSGGMTKTMFDLSHPSGPVLGGLTGNALFTTPLAILFDHGVNFVSFNLGHLDPGSPTLVEAYNRDGQSLGVFSGFPSGHTLVSLAESTGGNMIGGISVYVPESGMDWEGFGLSNISFGVGEGETPVIPEPATIVVWSLLGGFGFSAVWYQRRRQVAAC